MTSKKQLYKQSSNKILGGVCQGIAECFDIDTTTIRIIWFILSWFYGIGVAIYIFLWIILPNKDDINCTNYDYESFYKK